ncbi:hypothetical protein GCM10007916_01320 [Psychromonas marina]|uniref:Uncharacterized protein n=1 Tax=Psychromonas marina TaxID=88364 RepID=A0ABQ6DVF4_9GAMM|nr:hypothetical protein [Psychromonas marina]GLS89065.1 hypothetical protein GCM10007916_01320 [Psychromonas marina]
MLTKGRLAQLLFMLGVLLVLFFWRTFDFSEQNEVVEVSQQVEEKQNISLLRCDYLTACEFLTEQGTFLLSVKNLPIKAEEWIDFELLLPTKNMVVSKAQIVGKTMFMGRIPVTFKRSEEQLFSANTLVGSCTTAQMIWSLEITVDNGELQELVSFDFMVQR